MAIDVDVDWFRKRQKEHPQLLSVIAQRIRACLGVRVGTLKYIDLAVIFKAAADAAREAINFTVPHQPFRSQPPAGLQQYSLALTPRLLLLPPRTTLSPGVGVFKHENRLL